MLKIMKELWDKNKDKLRTELSSRDDLNECSYVDLVKIAFDKIYNDDSRLDNENLFIDRVHEIDDGDYQGTLIYLIPFNSYQPDPEDYLMTFAWYGSCSGCDALQSAQSWGRRKTNGATGKRLYEHLQRLDLQRYQTLQLWMET